MTRFLVRESGVASARLTALGVGEDFPVQGLMPDDPRNRRVEVIRLGGGATPDRPGDGVEAAADARALLIGIDAYTTVSSLLGAPRNDVAAMRRYVEKDLGYRPDRVRTLLDADATREGIISGIRDWLLAGDRALLYFSGHGYQRPDTDGDEADGFDETLVPHDVVIENGVVHGMIADDEIDDLIAATDIPVEIIIDSCHSGTATRSGGVGDAWQYIKSPRTPDGSPLRRTGARSLAGVSDRRQFLSGVDGNVAVWAAVQAEQKALVDVESGPEFRSVFTRRLLSGLGGAADADASGIVTAGELETYVRRESDAYCAAQPRYCLGGLVPEISVPPGRSDASAFAAVPPPSPSVASLAKDLFVSPHVAGVGDPGALKLSLEPGTELPAGEELEVVVESRTSGSLVLLDIDPEGRMTQIFPNDWSESMRIAGGVVMRVPGNTADFRSARGSTGGTGQAAGGGDGRRVARHADEPSQGSVGSPEARCLRGRTGRTAQALERPVALRRTRLQCDRLTGLSRLRWRSCGRWLFGPFAGGWLWQVG